MIRLVSERSERDLAVAELGEALAEFAAQTMRLSAGAGNISRWDAALAAMCEKLARTIDGRPLLISEYEAQQALRIRRSDAHVSDIDYEVDEIARHSLRLVASRLENNTLQEGRSENDLFNAIRQLEKVQEERRQEHRRERLVVIRHAPARRKSPKPAASSSLSAPMIDALRFLSETDRNPLDGKRTPGVSTLRALVERGMIKRGEGPMGYVLTARGREARGRG